MLEVDFIVHCTREKDIKCQFGQHQEALLIMHNKLNA